MLPISESLYKGMARPDKGLKKKYYEVQDGDVYVHTGMVVHKATDFSSLPDGLYPFGETYTVSAYMISPWLIQKPVFDWFIELKSAIVERIYKLTKQLLSLRVDKQHIPHVRLEFKRILSDDPEVVSKEIMISLEVEGLGTFPSSLFVFKQTLRLGLDDYHDWTFAFNLVQLRDMLAPFANLKLEGEYITLEYGNREGDKVWLEYVHQGHTLTAASPFVLPEKKEERVTEQADADFDSEYEGNDDEEDFDVSEDDPAYLDEEKSPLTTPDPDLAGAAGPEPESDAGHSWLPPPKDNIISMHGEHVTALTEV